MRVLKLAKIFSEVSLNILVNLTKYNKIFCNGILCDIIICEEREMKLYCDTDKHYYILRDAYLYDKSCLWCKSTEQLVLHHLDIDRIEPRLNNIFYCKDEEKRNAEIAKCVVLCQKCHREYHKWVNRHKRLMQRYEEIKCLK